MSFLPQDIDQFNDDIKAWNNKTYKGIIAEMDALGIEHRSYSRSPKPLQKSLTSKLRKQDGIVNRIGYQFPRHGIFVHKGVSRGHGKANPRQRKEFLMPVVDKNFDELADIYLDGTGDLILNSLAIK